MSEILVDTSVLIRWLIDVKRLGPDAKGLLSDPKTSVYVSSISFLECAVKQRANKLHFDLKDLAKQIIIQDFTELTYDIEAAILMSNLPALPWKDPFDIAIIAQAINKNVPLITSDKNILTLRLDKLRTIDATQ